MHLECRLHQKIKIKTYHFTCNEMLNRSTKMKVACSYTGWSNCFKRAVRWLFAVINYILLIIKFKHLYKHSCFTHTLCRNYQMTKVKHVYQLLNSLNNMLVQLKYNFMPYLFFSQLKTSIKFNIFHANIRRYYFTYKLI